MPTKRRDLGGEDGCTGNSLIASRGTSRGSSWRPGTVARDRGESRRIDNSAAGSCSHSHP